MAWALTDSKITVFAQVLMLLWCVARNSQEVPEHVRKQMPKHVEIKKWLAYERVCISC
jgi:hypothetical protein